MSLQKPCLIWQGAHTAGGYGNRWVDGKNVVQHRYAWEQAHGPIPEGYELHHLCHVRDCYELEHLQMVTRAEHRRIEGLETTHCPRGHEYTDENTYIRKTNNGHRDCRTCHRDRTRERRVG